LQLTQFTWAGSKFTITDTLTNGAVIEIGYWDDTTFVNSIAPDGVIESGNLEAVSGKDINRVLEAIQVPNIEYESINLFNVSTTFNDRYVVAATGEISTGTTVWSVSKFIKVIPNGQYSLNKQSKVYAYNKNGYYLAERYVNPSDVNATFNAGAEDVFFRLQTVKTKSSASMLVIGALIPPYTAFKEHLPNRYISDATREEIKDSITIEHIPLLRRKYGVKFSSRQEIMRPIDLTTYGISIVFRINASVTGTQHLMRFEIQSGIIVNGTTLAFQNNTKAIQGGYLNAIKLGKLNHLTVSNDGSIILNGINLSSAPLAFINGRVEVGSNSSMEYFSIKIFDRPLTINESLYLFNNSFPLDVNTPDTLMGSELIHLDARDIYEGVWKDPIIGNFTYTGETLISENPQPKITQRASTSGEFVGQTIINTDDVAIQTENKTRSLLDVGSYQRNYLRDNLSKWMYKVITTDYRSGNNRLGSKLTSVSTVINNSDGKHRAFGGSAYDSTNYFITYRKGDTHFSTGDNGVAIMVKSLDSGLTWGSEVIIASEVNRDVRDPTLFLTSTGRLICKYFSVVAGSFTSFKRAYTIYSDDAGTTWSAPFQIDLPPGELDTDATTGAWENTIESDGVLYTTSTVGQVVKSYIFLLKSIDNGATWSFVSIVHNKTGVAESSLMLTTDNKMYCVMRDNEGLSVENSKNEALIAYSDDLGVTWNDAEKLPMLAQSPFLFNMGVGLNLLVYRARSLNLFTIDNEQEVHAVVLKDGLVYGEVIQVDSAIGSIDTGYPSVVEIGSYLHFSYYDITRGILVRKILKTDLNAI